MKNSQLNKQAKNSTMAEANYYWEIPREEVGDKLRNGTGLWLKGILRISCRKETKSVGQAEGAICSKESVALPPHCRCTSDPSPPMFYPQR